MRFGRQTYTSCGAGDDRGRAYSHARLAHQERLSNGTSYSCSREWGTDVNALSISSHSALRRPRALLLFAITLNFLLIAVRALLYSPLWAQPGAVTYVLEPVVLLLVYGGIVLWATAGGGHRVALSNGAAVGLITGLMWIVNLTLETFSSLSGLAATAPFLLGAFALWGAAAFRASRVSASVPTGILTAVWGAMICVLLTITVGLLFTYTSLPRLEHGLLTDPDFLRSHWRDLRAFAIANSFDAAFSHLLGGLIVGAIVGAVGSVLGPLGASRGNPAARIGSPP